MRMCVTLFVSLNLSHSLLQRQNSPRSESGVIDLTATDLADCYVLRELKTRRQHSMPSDAQARGTALQLCIYKQLWDQLCAPGAAGRFPAVHFWAIQRVVRCDIACVSQSPPLCNRAFHILLEYE